MSPASHHGDAPASAGHDHHYDGIPADTVGPDEPHTPGWLTLLGVGLVLSVLFLFALKQPEQKTRAELTQAPAGSAPAASAEPPARPMPPPQRPQNPQEAAARVLGAASGLPLVARPGMSAPARQMQRPSGPAGLAAPRPGAAPAPAAPAPHIHRPGEPPH